MRFEAVNSFGDCNSAERLTPGDRIGLLTRFGRKCIRRFGPAANESVYFFFDVDEWLSHEPNIGEVTA
jgi:hypothetical protein